MLGWQFVPMPGSSRNRARLNVPELEERVGRTGMLTLLLLQSSFCVSEDLPYTRECLPLDTAQVSS